MPSSFDKSDDVTLKYTTTHFNVWSDPTKNFFPNLSHTHTGNAQLYGAVVVEFSEKLGRNILYPPSYELWICGVRIHYTNCSTTAASSIQNSLLSLKGH